MQGRAGQGIGLQERACGSTPPQAARLCRLLLPGLPPSLGPLAGCARLPPLLLLPGRAQAAAQNTVHSASTVWLSQCLRQGSKGQGAMTTPCWKRHGQPLRQLQVNSMCYHIHPTAQAAALAHTLSWPSVLGLHRLVAATCRPAPHFCVRHSDTTNL